MPYICTLLRPHHLLGGLAPAASSVGRASDLIIAIRLRLNLRHGGARVVDAHVDKRGGNLCRRELRGMHRAKSLSSGARAARGARKGNGVRA